MKNRGHPKQVGYWGSIIANVGKGSAQCTSWLPVGIEVCYLLGRTDNALQEMQWAHER